MLRMLTNPYNHFCQFNLFKNFQEYRVAQRLSWHVSEPTMDTPSGQFTYSIDSQDILNYLEQPIFLRSKICYQIDFLKSYKPNTNFYLPAPLRRQLFQMGKTPDLSAPAGTFSRQILNRLLIDLSWASSHLEGNTYTYLDTQKLFESGQEAQGRLHKETQMIMNHKAAIEMLVENLDQVGFNKFTLMNLHGTLSENLISNKKDQGTLRHHPVGIAHSGYQPIDSVHEIEEHLSMFLDKLAQIEDPFEQSFFAMVHIPYLQPFADVNKRTSRLLANLSLFRENLCPLTFVGVPADIYAKAIISVYELQRVELLRDLYVWAYQKSTQAYLTIKQDLEEPDPIGLQYRELIRDVVREVILSPDEKPYPLIQEILAKQDLDDLDEIQAIIISELRDLNQGKLFRFRINAMQLQAWQKVNTGKTHRSGIV